MAQDLETRIRASFGRQSLMSTIGAEVIAVTHGQISLTAPVDDAFRQQQGYAHGGLVFALGDTAAGYAALTVLPAGFEVLTVELKINFLSPGMGRLVAQGRVLKPGRRLIVVAADVWSEDEAGARKHVAALLGTMIPVPPA